MIIPLIGALLTISGVTTLVWYSGLSKEKQEKYDRKVADLFKRKMSEAGVGITIDDNEASIKLKASRQGMNEAQVRRIINESREEAKKDMQG